MAEEKEVKEVKKDKKAKPEPKPASFETVEKPKADKNESSETIGLLMDVELELTAELGSAELPIKKILDFTKGTIIELDTYTSNPIDLLANGKVIAKGEVVIIEDNFGLRITDVSEDGKGGGVDNVAS